MTEKKQEFKAFVDILTASFIEQIAKSISGDESLLSILGIPVHDSKAKNLSDILKIKLNAPGEIDQAVEFLKALIFETPDAWDTCLIASLNIGADNYTGSANLFCFGLEGVYVALYAPLDCNEPQLNISHDPYDFCELSLQDILASSKVDLQNFEEDGRLVFDSYRQDLNVFFDFHSFRKTLQSFTVDHG